MSSERLPEKSPRMRPASKTDPERDPDSGTFALRIFDGILLTLFLGLTFLLGMFPLKDTDFWWHLRTGDLIRKNGEFPRTDWYTYGAPSSLWVDLHWIYQVSISWLYERGGVPILTLAKCVVTTLAVALLVTARRRGWPLWAILVAWLPALLVLGGRMYVRPETLTLLYLSCFLAILVRIDQRPWLAFLLPIVQLFWVNTQGLFVFGPVLLGTAILDQMLRAGAFAPGRSRWRRIVGAATVLTGLACLINPYGLRGALYPVQIAGTMANPVFSRSIAELTPVNVFIARGGLVSLPLQLQFVTMFLGALSFLLPMCWVVWTRARRVRSTSEVAEVRATTATRRESAKGTAVAKADANAAKSPKKAKSKRKSVADAGPGVDWRLSPFRFLLFVAFSVLSWQATRNSHQFAAVVGTITAWNFAEWAGAWRKHARELAAGASDSVGGEVVPRFAALAAILGVLVWVGSGWFYKACNEGRTIGLGEEPLWYPHEAVKFCGTPGMPEKFVGFHIGHASLYDYYFGPERKVWVDARLEVIGPELYQRYAELQRRITSYTALMRQDPESESFWQRELDDIGRPAVLTDHANSTADTAALLMSRDWRCVYFDAVAAVFVHSAYADVVREHQVDFARRHFQPDPVTEPLGREATFAMAKALRELVWSGSILNPGRIQPMLALGLNYARREVEADRNSPDAWKMLGQIEMFRDPVMNPVARFRSTFDPVFDLTTARATYALKRAVDLGSADFTTLFTLEKLFEGREMHEAALPLLQRLLSLTPINSEQSIRQAALVGRVSELKSAMGEEPPASWSNLSELGQIVNRLLSAGRAGTAADYLERAAPEGSRSWEEADRIATLRLHLGEPSRARAVWQWVANPPSPAIRQARVAATYLVEADYPRAREAYLAALQADPTLFEALYGLATLEQDDGHAREALDLARRAVNQAPSEFARGKAQGIVAFVTPYALPRIAEER